MSALEPITVEEALKVLAHCGECCPSAESHYEADQVLLRLINNPDVAAAYNAIMKWYA